MSDGINPFGSSPTGQHTGAPNQLPPQRSNGKSPLLLILGIVAALVLVPIICCGVVGVLGFTTAVGAIKAPVDAAVVALNEDPAVAAKLGTPIEEQTGFGVNDYNNNNGNGGATVNFNVTGPNGSAEVSGRMDLTAGVWSADDLTVQCSDGTKLKVP